MYFNSLLEKRLNNRFKKTFSDNISKNKVN